LRFEAKTRLDLVEYMKHFKVLLDQHPDINQTKFNEQIATFSAPATAAH
jgi:hypothetical protein